MRPRLAPTRAAPGQTRRQLGSGRASAQRPRHRSRNLSWPTLRRLDVHRLDAAASAPVERSCPGTGANRSRGLARLRSVRVARRDATSLPPGGYSASLVRLLRDAISATTPPATSAAATAANAAIWPPVVARPPPAPGQLSEPESTQPFDLVVPSPSHSPSRRRCHRRRRHWSDRQSRSRCRPSATPLERHPTRR